MALFLTSVVAYMYCNSWSCNRNSKTIYHTKIAALFRHTNMEDTTWFHAKHSKMDASKCFYQLRSDMVMCWCRFSLERFIFFYFFCLPRSREGQHVPRIGADTTFGFKLGRIRRLAALLDFLLDFNFFYFGGLEF